MSEKIVQTAGREKLGEFAPMFAHLKFLAKKQAMNGVSLFQMKNMKR